MAILIMLALAVIASVVLNVVLVRHIGCIFRQHNTIPLKRIGKHAFVVACINCGWLFIKTHEYGRPCYRRYNGQFNDFEDYADEPAEAEPMFVDDEDANV